MDIKGIVWTGTRTANYDEVVRFFAQKLGLELSSEERDFAVFRCPNGDKVEVFGPSDEDHPFFTTGPVPGFLVDDVESARRELEAAGVEFLHPVVQGDHGYRWTHFRAPDGNVYDLTSGPFGEDADRATGQP